MMSWWFLTFMAPAIKYKVHNVEGVEFLYSAICRDQLEIPAYITEHDMRVKSFNFIFGDKKRFNVFIFSDKWSSLRYNRML